MRNGGSEIRTSSLIGSSKTGEKTDEFNDSSDGIQQQLNPASFADEAETVMPGGSIYSGNSSRNGAGSGLGLGVDAGGSGGVSVSVRGERLPWHFILLQLLFWGHTGTGTGGGFLNVCCPRHSSSSGSSDDSRLNHSGIQNSKDNVPLWQWAVPCLIVGPPFVLQLGAAILALECANGRATTTELLPCDTRLPHLWVWIGLSGLVSATMLVCNAVFGFHYCVAKRTEQVLTWVTMHSNKSRADLVVSLSIIGWAGWGFLAIAVALDCLAQYGVGNGAHIFLVAWSAVYAWGMPFYLCLLWLWENWCLHHATVHFVDNQVTEHFVTSETNSSGRLLLRLLCKIQSCASYWTYNHAVRLLSVALLATFQLLLFVLDEREQTEKEKYHVLGSDRLALALLFYALVWLTAAAPGGVSDQLFNTLQCRLADLLYARPVFARDYIEQDFAAGTSSTSSTISRSSVGNGAGSSSGTGTGGSSSSSSLTNREQRILRLQEQQQRLQRDVLTLMQMADTLKSRRTMHFMGYPVTKGSVFVAGAFVSYLIANAVLFVNE